MLREQDAVLASSRFGAGVLGLLEILGLFVIMLVFSFWTGSNNRSANTRAEGKGV